MAEHAGPYRILFVCTGNIFRSLTADVALRRLLADDPGIHVSSAGTDDYPHVMRPYTSAYLRSKGFDVSGHQRRTLTEAILGESRLVVSMSTDHQAFIREFVFDIKDGKFRILEVVPKEKTIFPPDCKFVAT